MSLSTNTAKSGYASASAPVRTSRGAEYAIFARVTRNLNEVDETDKAAFPRLAHAVYDNSRLWTALSADLLTEGNALPDELRAQLVSLGEFVRKHSLQVISGEASIAPLIDINTSIMRGLRGEVEEAV